MANWEVDFNAFTPSTEFQVIGYATFNVATDIFRINRCNRIISFTYSLEL